MSDFAAPRPHTEPVTGTGGPKDRKHLVEQIAGWTLTVVIAMLIVQLHLM
ncbi:SCO1431 family membrane protein [Actinacidiphila alni]